MAITAAAIVPIALLVIPMMTGLKMTPIHEWIGAILGLVIGYALAVPRSSLTRNLFRRSSLPRR
jgi:ABC-type amino acid transport system permease subunit